MSFWRMPLTSPVSILVLLEWSSEERLPITLLDRRAGLFQSLFYWNGLLRDNTDPCFLHAMHAIDRVSILVLLEWSSEDVSILVLLESDRVNDP